MHQDIGSFAAFINLVVKPLLVQYPNSDIISTGVLSRKMRKQGVRISPPVQDSQELSLYMCLYSYS